MSTDRELLELAAKAAGLNVKAYRVDVDDNFTHLVVGKKNTRERADWNPLTDDGDALRLAVKLRIYLRYDGVSSTTPAYAIAVYPHKKWRMDSTHKWMTENYVPEEMFVSEQAHERSHAAYQLEQGLVRGLEVATRRAIVRAAGEIGRNDAMLKARSA